MSRIRTRAYSGSYTMDKCISKANRLIATMEMVRKNYRKARFRKAFTRYAKWAAAEEAKFSDEDEGLGKQTEVSIQC